MQGRGEGPVRYHNHRLCLVWSLLLSRVRYERCVILGISTNARDHPHSTETIVGPDAEGTYVIHPAKIFFRLLPPARPGAGANTDGLLRAPARQPDLQRF